jgi:uncharacterized protein (TIGR00251 family)
MENVENLNLRGVQGGCVIAVKAVPGASRDRVAGVLGDCLKVTTTAPAEKGKANRALAAILARALGVGTGSLVLVSGAGNPRKEFRVAGLRAEEARSRLAALSNG